MSSAKRIKVVPDESSSSSTTTTKERLTTIDERVMARAAANQRQFLAETNNNNNSNNNKSSMDRQWLLQLADALWFHSKSILKKQLRLYDAVPLTQSTAIKRKRPTALCVMTLQDALACLSPHATTGTTNGNHSGNTSRRRLLANALLQLCDLVPEWIQIDRNDTTTTTTTTAHADGLRRDSTVWIHTDRFATARAILAGTELPVEPKTAIPESSMTTTTDKTTHQPIQTNTTPLTSTTTTTTPHTSSSNTLSVAASQPLVPLVTAEKKEPVSGTKRVASPDTNPRCAKKQKSLRINPHLILSDADHSTYTSEIKTKQQQQHVSSVLPKKKTFVGNSHSHTWYPLYD